MKVIKDRIKSKTFQEIEEIKGSHSKVKNLRHENLQMQKYLKPNRCKMNIEDGQLIFKLRCKITNAKMNFKGVYDNLRMYCLQARRRDTRTYHKLYKAK